MIPKLIVCKNEEKIANYIKTLSRNFSISPFNIITLGKSDSSIKIEETRELKEKLKLKPFSGKKKLVIIYNAENLTKEAQNSLLKSLEEPPEDTVILLSTPNENLLLPTIISRCEVTRIKNDKNIRENPASIRENPKVTLTNDIRYMDIGEKFKLAEQLSAKIDKEESLESVRNRVEEWLNHLLENSKTTQNLKVMKNIVFTKKRLRQNLNIRLVLENLLINL